MAKVEIVRPSVARWQDDYWRRTNYETIKFVACEVIAEPQRVSRNWFFAAAGFGLIYFIT